MNDICVKCSPSVTSDDPAYTCDGVCKRRYHVSCLSVASAVFKELTKTDTQCLWLCLDCLEARRSGRSLMLQDLTSALSSLKDQLMDEFELRLASALDEAKRALSVKLSDTIPCAMTQTHDTPLTPAAPTLRKPFAVRPTYQPELSNTSKRRLIDRSPPFSEAVPPLLSGTAAAPTSSRPLLTVSPAPPRFWLYLTRIAPSVSEADVETFVKEQLGTDDVTIRKLTPRDCDTGTLTFVSFKVGMSSELRDKALSPATWPCNVSYREFVEHRKSQTTATTFLRSNPVFTTANNQSINNQPSLASPSATASVQEL